ncbi:hypothetical protein BDV06DRAFT_207430 [Aspergillus oleicola]
MSYEVYTAEYIGQPNHVAIYIETQPSADEQTRSGLMYHVVGNILQGMTCQKRDTKDPLLSATYGGAHQEEGRNNRDWKPDKVRN